MKIRLMGKLEELEFMRARFIALRSAQNVDTVEISRPYPNRGDSVMFRMYIEIIYKPAGRYQQRTANEPWQDVSDFGARSALTCNGGAWEPLAARMAAGEIIRTEFAEYRLLKDGGAA